MGKKKFIDKKTAATFAVVHRSQRDPLLADDTATPLVLVPVELPGSARRKANAAGRSAFIQGNEDYFDNVDEVEYDKNVDNDGDSQDEDNVDEDGLFDDSDNDDDSETKQEQKATKSKPVVSRTRVKPINSNPGEAAKYGILYDDTQYDYTKHLKEIGSDVDGVFVSATAPPAKQKKPDTVQFKSDDIHKRLGLPAEVFASEYEEDVGILNLAAPTTGPQPELGPDVLEVLEALEDEAYEGELPDDFLAELDASGDEDENVEYAEDDGDSLWEDEEEWQAAKTTKHSHDHDQDSQAEQDDDDNDDDDNDDDVSLSGLHAGDDRKTARFTQYSMTSSILPRSADLQLLDDRFEKLMEQYDEEHLGALDNEDPKVQGVLAVDHYDDFMDKFLIEEGTKAGLMGVVDSSERILIKQGLKKPTPEALEQIQRETERALRLEQDDDEKELIEVDDDEEQEKANWDVESVLTTYSNLENHPAIIKEKRAQIRVNRRGFPVVQNAPSSQQLDQVNKNSLQQAEAQLPSQSTNANADHHDEDKEEDARSIMSTVSMVRTKDETPEEKRLRKKAVKDHKRERRSEKKSTKLAFAAEKQRQEREQHQKKITSVSMHL